MGSSENPPRNEKNHESVWLPAVKKLPGLVVPGIFLGFSAQNNFPGKKNPRIAGWVVNNCRLGGEQLQVGW